jgi:hypothetical protein
MQIHIHEAAPGTQDHFSFLVATTPPTPEVILAAMRHRWPDIELQMACWVEFHSHVHFVLTYDDHTPSGYQLVHGHVTTTTTDR